MGDEVKVEKIQVERDYLARLERELEELKAAGELERRRAGLLEGQIKREAVDAARRRVLSDCLGRQNVPLDISRALALLERLTQDVAAEVDDGGRAVVPEGEERKIREQVEAIVGSVRVGGGQPPVAPPISPGEPPRRAGRGGGGGMVNSWDAAVKKGGTARGKEMIASAARELEREGKI